MKDRKPTRIEAGSYYTYLSEGCRLCRRGAKLVLFVTGLCPNSCFYCPISEERKGKDVIFANEREVKTLEDIVKEIELMSAEGASITGGEPFFTLEKTLEIARFLKKFDLHIHVYTSLPREDAVVKISQYVDEIRFHPVKPIKLYDKPVKTAKKLGLEVGIEIPALNFDKNIVSFVNKHDIFMNLNELEFSATNQERLISMGFESGEFFEAKGCREIAEKYLKTVEKFHYCTVLFKDRAQMRRRLIRMAMNHPDFYLVTNDGTLICGRIECSKEEFKKLKRILDEMDVEYKIYKISELQKVIVELSAELAEKLSEDLKAEGFSVSIVERYPTANRLVVEKVPL
ncbi:MAG: radical SAM protein [Archaeoglobus sp.]|nr:MAG: radical SAM protein [Archaeoglobus sp.]